MMKATSTGSERIGETLLVASRRRSPRSKLDSKQLFKKKNVNYAVVRGQRDGALVFKVAPSREELLIPGRSVRSCAY
jgi:hypothetical protein